jgi:phospholipid/cholesterol/gamma-HCH transport system substrate-binding protein
MPRTRSVAWAELKLGVVGVVALLMVTLLIISVGGQGGFPWQRFPLKTRFDDVQGLKTGAVVRLNGQEVGKVTGITFQGPQLEVVMEVSKSVRPLITTESVASVGSLSLLGEPIIDLKAATSGHALADWAYVKSGPPGGPVSSLAATASQSLDEAGRLIADVRTGRGTAGKLITDDTLYREMEQFVVAATDVTNQLKRGEGTLGGLMKDPTAYNDLKASLDTLKTITTKINAGEGPLGRFINDETMGKSLAATTASAEQITDRLTRGEGTAGKLLTDRQLYDRFNSLAGRIDQLLAGLDAGRGTAGRMLHDERLYETMNQAATELRSLLADIRKDPKKFLHMTVSIF